jgi:hypothetical protein
LANFVCDRQLDGAIGSLDVLPEIVDAVGDKLTVLLDSGVRTGIDVIKALCLGAKGVLVGRPWVYGLGIGGKEGAKHAVQCILAVSKALCRAMFVLTFIRTWTRAWAYRALGPSQIATEACLGKYNIQATDTHQIKQNGYNRKLLPALLIYEDAKQERRKGHD